MSTHAVNDTFIETYPEYDLTGFRLLNNADGCECLVISNAMHGGYMQIGLHERDPYTRRNNPKYVPPNARSPPRPWSIRLKEPRLRPVEICFSRTSIPNAFLGKDNGNDVIRNCSPTVCGASVKSNGSYPVEWVVRATPHDRRMIPGNLEITLNTPTWTQDFVNNVYEVRPGTTTVATSFSVFYPSSTILGLPFISNYPNTYNPKSITYFISYTLDLPAPISLETEAYADVFTPIPDQNILGKVRTITVMTPDGITRYNSWQGPDIKLVPLARESPMDWLVTVAKFSKPPIRLSDRTLYPPVLIVPHMIAFKPRFEEEGPIDSRTGRRLCNGDYLITHLTTMPVPEMFSPGTTVTLYMQQISRPITNAPIFNPDTDLAKLLGIEVGDQRLANEYEEQVIAKAVAEARAMNEVNDIGFVLDSDEELIR